MKKLAVDKTETEWKRDLTPMQFHVLREKGTVTREVRLASGQGLPGRAWASGEALWSEDVLHEPHEPRIVPALRAGLHGSAAIPVAAGQEVRAVLELFATGARKEDEDLLLRLGDMGRQIGRAAARPPGEG